MKYLLVDVGNTSVTFALTKGKRLGPVKRNSPRQFRRGLKSLIRRHKLQRALICSVVPLISRQLRTILRKNKVKVLECGKEVTIPVKNLYGRPKEVGQDRLINVYAANYLYKDVRLIIDAGTALTFDFISKRGEYLGGLIFPGVSISLASLLEKCALLPKKVALRTQYVLEGKTTTQCVSSGMTLGYSFLVRGLVEHIKGKRAPFKLLLTGGDCRFIIKSIAKFDYVDRDLSLKGLNILTSKIHPKITKKSRK